MRHSAVGLNFTDVYYRSGLYPSALPFIPGREGVGVVESVGPDVTGLRQGDRVGYVSVTGSYVERRLIAAEHVVKLPETIDDREAAAVMLKGMTARCLVREVYPVSASDTVLVHAAAGGVGMLLCQWACALGATVIGTVSTDEKAELARANGCHYPIVYTREDFPARVETITAGRKLPVVYDSIGKDTFAKSLDCLQPRGLMVVFGQSSGAIPGFDVNVLGRKGSLMLTRPLLPTFIASRPRLEAAASELFSALSNGIVKVNVNQTYPLSEAARAHRDLEMRRTTGATVLTV